MSPRGGARPEAGRKPMFEDEITITICIERELHTEISKLAQDRDISLSRLMRDSLAVAVDDPAKRTYVQDLGLFFKQVSYSDRVHAIKRLVEEVGE